MTIVEKYKILKNSSNENKSKLDQLVLDCFNFNILKIKASNSFKKEFEKIYDIKYPINEEDLTSKVVKELKSAVKIKKDEEKLEKKYAKQRVDRGFDDVAIWNYNSWFAETTSKIFKEYSKNHVGHPIIDEDGNYIRIKEYIDINDQDYDKMDKKWSEILSRIAFLSSELVDETCSMCNEQEKLTNEWYKLYEDFYEKYGISGSKLKTKEEVKKEKETGYITHIMPDTNRNPDKEFVKKYKIASKNLYRFEKNLYKYQNKCKNELFDLLKKYYWDLWD